MHTVYTNITYDNAYTALHADVYVDNKRFYKFILCEKLWDNPIMVHSMVGVKDFVTKMCTAENITRVTNDFVTFTLSNVSLTFSYRSR